MPPNKPRILLYYPEYSKKYGHHKAKNSYMKMIMNAIEDVADIVMVLDNPNGVPPSLKHCEELCWENSTKLCIIPFFDEYARNLWKNPILDSSLHFFILWINPLPFKGKELDNLNIRVKETIKGLILGKSNFLKASTIWVLDEYSMSGLKKHFNDVFCLPDPSPLNYKSNSYKSTEYDFILYGDISPRKGLHTFLEALEILEADGHKFNSRVIGRMNPKALSPSAKRKLIRLVKSKQIEFTNGYVDEKILIEAISASSTVVLPYVNFYVSSNILSTACEFRKKIITSDIGTIGKRVVKHDLGTTFRANDAKDLSEKMLNSVKLQPKLRALQSFSSKHRRIKFKSLIRESMEKHIK